MIVIDMDMPTSCRDCYMMCADIKRNHTERPKDCPIKCDIEDIDREIRKSRREPVDDELDESVNYGLNKALEIIVKHIGG
jgi:hypothetical protein